MNKKSTHKNPLCREPPCGVSAVSEIMPNGLMRAGRKVILLSSA